MNEFAALGQLDRGVPKLREILAKLVNFNRMFGRTRKAYRAVAAKIDLTGGGVTGAPKGTISGFKAPSRKQIEQQAEVMFEYAHLDMMEDLLAHLESSEHKATKARADKIRPLYLAAADAYDDALDILHELAEASAPAEIVKYFRDARKAVSQTFEVADRELNTFVQIDFVGDTVRFAQFIELTEYTKTPQRIMLAATADLLAANSFNKVVYGITSVRTVPALRQLSPDPVDGTTVAKLALALKKELSIRKIVMKTSRLDIPVSEDKLADYLGDSVSDVEVDGTEIYVRLNKANEKEVYAALQRMPDIHAALRKLKATLRVEKSGTDVVFYIER